MKQLYLILLSLFMLLPAEAAQRFVGPTIFESTIKPNATGQDMNDSSSRWDIWVGTLNTSLGTGFAYIDGSGYLQRLAYGTSAQYLRGDGALATLNTDAVPEGSNLYFTDERAQDATGAMATSSSKVSLTYNDAANTLTPDIVAGSLTNADVNAAAAIAYSKLNLAGSIVNADVASGAAIAYSKLNLAGSIVSSDITDGTIVNADVNAAAAIAYSKLNLAASVANSDLATMVQSTFKGRAAGAGTGAPTDLSATQAQAIVGSVPQILTQQSTPSSPSAGTTAIYVKSDDKLYKKTSAGVESEIGGASGGGSGAGGVNFIALDTSFGSTKSTNQDLESSVGDWAAYADAAGTSPVDMTGGSPTTTCTRSTSTPLNGTGSLLLTKDAANRQGEGCSVTANVPPGYRGVNTTVEFPFSIVTGSVSSGDIKVFLYDVTNSISFNPVVSLSGTSGIVRFSVPSSSSSAQYRFGFHIATTSTAALTIKFDDIYFGSNKNVVDLSQAEFYGFAQVGGTGCAGWSLGSGATSYTNFPATTGCTGNSASGGVSLPSTMIPGIRLVNAPPGKYVIQTQFSLYRLNNANYRAYARLWDGTSSPGDAIACSGGVDSAGLNECPSTIESVFVETNGVTDKTYQIQGMQDNAHNVNINAGYNGTQYSGVTFNVYRFPLDTQKVVKPDNSDVPSTSFTPTWAGFSSIGSANFYWSRVGEFMYIRGSFNPGGVAAVKATLTLPGGYAASSAYPSTTTTVGYGDDSHADRKFIPTIKASQTYLTFCKSNSGVAGNCEDNADAWSASEVKTFFAWVRIEGWTTSSSAPLLVNSVVNDYAGVTKICTGKVANSGTPTLTRSDGSCVASLTDNGTGDTTLTFASGTFSGTPNCGCHEESAGGTAMLCLNHSSSSSAYRVYTTNSTNGALTDGDFTFSCIGPK